VSRNWERRVLRVESHDQVARVTDGISSMPIVLADGSQADWAELEEGVVFAGKGRHMFYTGAFRLKRFLGGEHDEHKNTASFFREVPLAGAVEGLGAIRGFFKTGRNFVVQFESDARPAVFEDQGGSVVLAVQ